MSALLDKLKQKTTWLSIAGFLVQGLAFVGVVGIQADWIAMLGWALANIVLFFVNPK